MIEINLQPEEVRQKIAKQEKQAKLRNLLYIIPILGGILLILHVYFTILLVANNMQLSSLSSRFKKLEPEKKALEQAKKEQDLMSQDAVFTRQLIAKRINISEKLNRLSLDLPGGIWFNELTLNSKELALRGSVISLQKEEMGLINKFITNLKEDKTFIDDFIKIELSSAQARTLGGYEVIDFVLLATLKPR